MLEKVENNPSDILHRVHWFHNEHELDELGESEQGRGATLHGEGTFFRSHRNHRNHGNFVILQAKFNKQLRVNN